VKTENDKIELIGLDEIANQAILLANPKNFDLIKESSITLLDEDLDEDCNIILVASKLDTESVIFLLFHLEEKHSPLLIIPEGMADEDDLKKLFKSKFRIFFAPSNNLPSISLANTISLVESLIYPKEFTITPEMDSIYDFFSPSTKFKYITSENKNISKAILELISRKISDEPLNILVIFEIDDDFDLISISNSLDVIQKRFKPINSLVFYVKTLESDSQNSKITLVISERVSFLKEILEELNKKDGYFLKILYILEQYRNNNITSDEFFFIAEKEDLNVDDISFLEKFRREANEDIVRLIKVLKNEDLDESTKIDLVANIFKDATVTEKTILEIASIFDLPLDKILNVALILKNDKLNVRELKLDLITRSILRTKYPDIFLGIHGLFPIIVSKTDVEKEIIVEDGEKLEGDFSFIHVDSIKHYEDEKGISWGIGKDLDHDIIKDITDQIRKSKEFVLNK
jgi:hypothetical protein